MRNERLCISVREASAASTVYMSSLHLLFYATPFEQTMVDKSSDVENGDDWRPPSTSVECRQISQTERNRLLQAERVCDFKYRKLTAEAQRNWDLV